MVRTAASSAAPAAVTDWDFRAGAAADAVRRAFRAFGFVIIRSVIEPKELARLRMTLDEAFAGSQLRELPTMWTTEVLKHESVWRCLFKERVVEGLRAALGPELCYLSDAHVQRNSYGQAGLQRHAGWHMDAGSETHHAYLRSDGYRFAKCGIFLQDFANGWGGGIRVKPKSHRKLSEPDGLKRKLFLLRRIVDRAAIRMRVDVDTLQVPTRAGDLCFFDSRLLHSSVLPSSANIRSIGYDRREDVGSFWAELPAEHTKYVLYWDACNQAMVEDFLRNSMLRAETEVNSMQEPVGRTAAFTRYLAVKYPEDYPADFVAAARGRGVMIATLTAEQTALYKQKLQSLQLVHS